MAAFREGDVIHYTSERANRWCREGMAVAGARGDRIILVDTYWNCGGDSHVLTDAEFSTARLLFNLADYDELDQYAPGSRSRWAKYAPDDRQIITSQHGLQARYFIRKGAVEHLPTQIENAREAVEEAERKVASAQTGLDQKRQELAALEAQAVRS